MEVRFRTGRLERAYRHGASAIRAFGDGVGRRYIQRINLMKAARDVDELLRLPGLRGHPLKGDRMGQYAIRLTGFMRLIFTVETKPQRIVWIEQVSKHYDD